MRAACAVSGLVLSLVLPPAILAQGTAGESPSVLTVIHRQAAGMMEEVLSRMGPSAPAAVKLSVEQAAYPRAVENAALQALQGHNVAVNPGTDSSAVLRLLLLEQSVGYAQLGGGWWARTIRTRLEARLEEHPGEGWRYLGEFERSEKDTVNATERPVVAGASLADSAQTPSAWERVVTPAVVLGGAVLIIYLFFTVRS